MDAAPELFDADQPHDDVTTCTDEDSTSGVILSGVIAIDAAYGASDTGLYSQEESADWANGAPASSEEYESADINSRVTDAAFAVASNSTCEAEEDVSAHGSLHSNRVETIVHASLTADVEERASSTAAAEAAYAAQPTVLDSCDDERIELDAKMTVGAIREILFEYLSLESVFPRFCDTDTGSAAHCLLRPDPRLLASPDSASKTEWRDHVLCKVLPKTRSPANPAMPTLTEFMTKLTTICGDVPMVSASRTNKYPLFARPEAYRTSRHPGVSNVLLVVNTEKALIVVQELSPHDISTLCRFHFETSLAFPSLARDRGVAARDLRLRFIVYQLLHAASYLHGHKLLLDPMDMKSIEVDNDLWTTIRLNFSHEMFSSLDRSQAIIAPALRLYKHPDHGVPLTLRWIERRISNFEYLMAINTAAGRIMGDVSRHPIIPWVTNFSADLRIGAKTNEFTLRDLTKSKFRLNKGEKQLESTFSHSDPPHHIPEILAELTYLIYMARKVPMHLLQRDVRSIFVPEHYPVSMARMFEWSPDECVPEFFMDPSVFTSTHKEHGLNDIELPKFAPTPHEFVSYHMMVLESDFVSNQLHHWIDLAFGSKLVGQAAIDNLNVPLCHSMGAKESLGGPPDLSKHPGFVVLFHSPHPRRRQLYLGCGDVDKYCVGPNASVAAEDKAHPSLGAAASSRNARQDMLAYVSADLARQDSVMSNLLSNMYMSLSGDATANPSDVSVDSNHSRGEKIRGEHKEGPSLLRSEEDAVNRLILHHQKRINIATRDGMTLLPISRGTERLDIAKFATDVAKVIEPAIRIHYDAVAASSYDQSQTDSESKRRKGWDHAFFEALNEYSSVLCSIIAHDDAVAYAQSNDLLSLGLLSAFLFCGESPLSEHEAVKVSKEVSSSSHPINVIRQYFYDNPKLAGISVATRRLLVLMLHPSACCRPTVSDILEACMIPDRLSGEDELKLEVCYKDISSSIPGATGVQKWASKIRRDFLMKYCGSIFPTYFSTAYSFISKLKLAESKRKRFESLVSLTSVIESIPLDGLSLLLVHVLPCISEASEVLEESIDNDVSFSSFPVDDMISSLCKVLDTLGARLGVEVFSVVVSPCVTKLFEKMTSTFLLRRMFGSQLFDVILHRAGLKTFLRYYLPIVITWLIAGSLKILLLTGQNSIGGDNISHMCWTSLDHEGRDVPDQMIHSSSLSEIQSVQEAAVQALGNLTQSRHLGPGLCLRYVLPAVLCLICNPNLAITGYCSEPRAIDFQTNNRRSRLMTEDLQDDILNADGTIRESVAELNEIIDALSTYNPQQMYAVRALEVLCMCFGGLATSEVVVPHIVHVMYPRLEALLAASPNVSSTANSCLLEFIQTIISIAPMLSPQTITNLFFTRQKSGVCILDLLLVIPMPRCQIFSEAPPEDAMNETEDGCESAVSTPPLFKSMVQFFRCYRSFIDLCRMVATLAQIAGAAATLEHVIPFVDTFFNIFIGIHSDIPVTSVAMSHAFNVGINLYMPLMQLVGPEAMAAAASHINPRLELWMSATSSGTVGRCPPLPGNILPDVVSEQDKKPEAGRLAKFMNWMSSSDKNNSNGGKTPKNNNNTSPQDPNSDGISGTITPPGVALLPLKDESLAEVPISKGRYFDNLILLQSTTTRLGISNKLQSHVNYARDGTSPPPAWTIKRTGAARKGVRNIFHGTRDERVGVMFTHMTGIDAADNDAAWLVSGTYRWRVDPNSVDGDDFTTEYVKAGGNQRGRSTMAYNAASAAIARRKGINPAAQLSLTSPKITVDTASDAGSVFSLQMMSKLQFYPDTVGVPVKLMVTNEVESLLLTGHRNGKVKLWNIADHPLSAVGKYSTSTLPQYASSGIFAGGFLRDSRHIYACDGTIRVWDTETREILVEIPSEGGFSTCTALPSSCGVMATIGASGDNILVASSGTSVYHFDLRVRNAGAYSAVAEWKLPIPMQNLSAVAESNVPGMAERRRSIAAASGSMQLTESSSSIPLLPQLTCCVTNNDVLYAGANNGFMAAVDRRSTKPLTTWQAHATGILKIFSYDRNGIVSVSDKSARIWELTGGQRLKLLAQVRGLPEAGSNGGISSSSILMNSFEHFDSYSDGKKTHFLYCLGGHKISAGRLPAVSSAAQESNYTQFSKETDDGDVCKLKKTSLADKTGASIPRQKLQITSAALLPLRQLLLVGSEDGLIRVVS